MTDPVDQLADVALAALDAAHVHLGHRAARRFRTEFADAVDASGVIITRYAPLENP